MLLRNRFYSSKGSQLNEHYNNAIPGNHVILIVHKLGFSFVSLLYSINQKRMVIFSLHLDKLNYEICAYNNNNINEQIWIC
jgi:hypothetical protein